jgi:hypothetical protein
LYNLISFKEFDNLKFQKNITQKKLYSKFKNYPLIFIISSKISTKRIFLTLKGILVKNKLETNIINFNKDI